MNEIFDVAERFSKALDNAYGPDRRSTLERAAFFLTGNPSRKFGIPLIGATVGASALALLFYRGRTGAVREPRRKSPEAKPVAA